MLRERLGGRQTREHRPEEPRVAYNESYVVAELDFEELVKVALPLTHWWRATWRTGADLSAAEQLEAPGVKKRVAEQLSHPGPSGFGGDVSPDLLWLMRVVGRIELERRGRRTTREPSNEQLVEAVLELVAAGDVEEAPPEPCSGASTEPAGVRGDLTVDPCGEGRRGDAALRPQLQRASLGGRGQRDRRDASRVPQADENGDLYTEPFEADGGAAARNGHVAATYDFTQLRKLLNPDRSPRGSAQA